MTQRTIRLNKLVSRELNLLLHTALRDSASKISVTEASVSPDLRDAYIYFSVIGDESDIREATRFLDKHSGFLRQQLFKKIQLKFSPRLTFRYDSSLARGQHISQLLDSL